MPAQTIRHTILLLALAALPGFAAAAGSQAGDNGRQPIGADNEGPRQAIPYATTNNGTLYDYDRYYAEPSTYYDPQSGRRYYVAPPVYYVAPPATYYVPPATTYYVPAPSYYVAPYGVATYPAPARIFDRRLKTWFGSSAEPQPALAGASRAWAFAIPSAILSVRNLT